MGVWAPGVSEAATYLPLLDIVPQVLELLKAQLACGVALAGNR